MPCKRFGCNCNLRGIKLNFPVLHFSLKTLLAALWLAGCCSITLAGAPDSTAPGRANVENHCFALDFREQTYQVGDVEGLFFTTFPHDDPTAGDVIYDRRKWVNSDMLKLVNGDGLYLFIKARGDEKVFDSFRMTSKPYYNLDEAHPRLLFVFKGHMPSARGLWPAWWLNGSLQPAWTYQNKTAISTDAHLDTLSGRGHFYDTPSAVNGTDWPAAGELDIIETINGENIVHNTLHTCPQMCDARWNDGGELINCANARDGDPNAGCSGIPYTLDAVEGTFACLWEKDRIRFYYWAPGEAVREAGGPLHATPNPDLWGGENLKNTAILLETETPCDSEAHQDWQCNNCRDSNTCSFQNMKMIFNITLCGKWAGARFDQSGTPGKNCRSYIFGEGKSAIHNQFIKIEYLSVVNIP